MHTQAIIRKSEYGEREREKKAGNESSHSCGIRLVVT